jgi:hypothetical protein
MTIQQDILSVAKDEDEGDNKSTRQIVLLYSLPSLSLNRMSSFLCETRTKKNIRISL